MYNMTKIFIKFLFLITIFQLSGLELLADSSYNGSCNNKDLISELNSISTDQTHTESGTLYDGQGIDDDNDYYYFKPGVEGSLKVTYHSNYNTDFKISTADCDTNRVLNNGTDYENRTEIKNTDTVYIRVKREKNNRTTTYSIKFEFTLTGTTPPPVSGAADLCYIKSNECSGFFSFMCKSTTPIISTTSDTLTDVTVSLLSSTAFSFFGDCGVDGTSGNCVDTTSTGFDFGPFSGFNQGITYSIANPSYEDEGDEHTTYLSSLFSFFSASYTFVASYYKNGTLYKGEIDECADDTTEGKLRDFELRVNEKLFGDIQVVGNTVLCVKSGNTCKEPSGTDSNANTNLSLAPESYATLDLPSGASVKLAYLYWQGRFPARKSQTSLTAEQQVLAKTIKMKTPTSGGFVTAANGDAQLDHYTTKSNNWIPIYSARKEVTSLVQQGGSGKYYISDLATITGETNKNSISDGLGAYGAWTLFVVYEDAASNKLKDISIFDGYRIVQASPESDAEIFIPDTGDLTGFYTPPSPADVQSTLYFFAGEGDKYIKGDKFYMKSSTQTTYKPLGPSDNAFNSRVSTEGDRNPDLINNNGIDIHKYDVGTTAGALGIMGNSATTAKFKLSTTQDTYMPSALGFSTDLYTPNICYSEEFYINGVKQLGQGIEVHTGDEITVRTWFSNTEAQQAEKVQIVHTFDDDFKYITGSTQVDNNNPAPLGVVPPPVTANFSSQTDSPGDDLIQYDTTTKEHKANLGDLASASNGGFFYESNKTTAVYEFTGEVGTFDGNYSLQYEAAYVADYGNFVLDFSLPGKRVKIGPCEGGGNSFYAPPVDVPQGGMDTVDSYTYGTYIGGSAGSTDGDGPGPDLTTKVTGEQTTFDIVYLGDGILGPVPFHPIDVTAKPMPVLLYVYEYNTTTGTYLNSGPLIGTNGQIAFATLNQGAVAATSVPLLLPMQAKRNVKIGMHYVDLNDNYASANKNCYYNSSLNGNLQDVPACLNNENNIEAIFDAATRERCTDLWGSGNQAWGPCSSNAQAKGYLPPYDVAPQCLACLLDNGAAPLSVDAFSIRPAQYELNTTVVQIDNNNNLDTTLVKLVAGEPYNITVKAEDIPGVNVIPTYTQSTVNLTTNTIRWMPDLTADVSNKLADVNATMGTANTFTNGAVSEQLVYNEAGIIDVNVSDFDWTAIDSDDTPITQYTHFNGSTRYGRVLNDQLRFVFKPFDFSLTPTLADAANNGAGFTYLSSDNNMSAKIPIGITARNKNAVTTKNYSDNLYEQLITFALDVNDSKYDQTGLILNSTIPVGADLNFVNGTANVGANDTTLVTMFNFTRDSSTPVNPFRILGTDIGISATDDDNVYGESNNTMTGQATFVYGRVHMPRTRAMCTVSPCTANTTYFYEFYGDRDANRSLIVSLLGATPARSVDSVNWYRNTLHTAGSNDGNVSSVSNLPAIVTVPTAPPGITQNGATTSVRFVYTGANGYPYKTTATLQSVPGGVQNTQPWLIYDKYGATSISSQVEYYGRGQWSSDIGATESVKDAGPTTNRNQNTNRRIKW